MNREKNPAAAPGPVNLLWTGGWDSTFRLLSLLAEGRAVIQPYYVLDAARGSLGMELQAMENIRRAAYESFPGSRERLLPTIRCPLADIPRNEGIRAKRQALLQGGLLGAQYDWLAEFAESNGLTDLELSVINDNGGYLYRLVKENSEMVQDGQGGPYRRLRAGIGDENPISLFRYYRFPVLELSKLDMANIAREKGFFELLCLSWFCATPLDGQACGACGTCYAAMELGMEFRFSPAAKRRYRFLTSQALPSRLGRAATRALKRFCALFPETLRKRVLRRLPRRVFIWWMLPVE